MRRSTPKHQIEMIVGKTVVYGPASKTDCQIAMRGMNRKGKPPVVRIIKVTAAR